MFKSIGFIGLGLMGGSIAKSIKKYHLAAEIVAYDMDQPSLIAAQNDGTIDKIATSIDASFANCDLLYLCCPVKVNVLMIKKILPFIKEDCLITDIGSTKSDIHTAMAIHAPKQPFIGGHPMTGSEKSGYHAANPILFENIYYVLTPGPTTAKSHLNLMTSFVKNIDSIPIEMNPQIHDQATAAISHVPHILAATLVNAVKNMDDSNGYMHTLAAGGFRDLTRIASGSPLMWESICLANRGPILDALDATKDAIDFFYQSVQTSDAQALMDGFTQAKTYRDSFSDQKPGLLPRVYSFGVDVDDQPGIIARIATLLYNSNINIKNIGVVNNRETDQGVLNIQFEDEKHMKESITLLRGLGYTIYE